MVNISKRKLDNYVFARLDELLIEVFALNKNIGEVNALFNSLFSQSERIMLTKRIGLVYLLLKRIKDVDICKALKISPSTVDRYKLMIEAKEENFYSLKKIINKEKVKNLLEEVFNILYGPGTPGVNWSEAWKRKKRIISRKKYGI